MKKDLLVYCNQKSTPDRRQECMSLEQLSMLARGGKIMGKLFSFRSVTLQCDSLSTMGQPFLVAAVCRLLTLGPCRFGDEEGNQMSVSLFGLIKLFLEFIKEQATATKYCNQVEKKVDALYGKEGAKKLRPGSALFLRCDLPYYYLAGGSLGHIAGVVNNLETCTGNPAVMLSSRKIPTVSDRVKFYEISAKVNYKNAGDIMSIAYNDNLIQGLETVLRQERISFIYQRSALNAYAGIAFAMKKNLPFVLEYNGSEIWIAKNWGKGKISRLPLSEKIERLTFEKANLITCVSKPLKQQLIEMGIEEDKIIVTPNGVNTDMYRPDIDGEEIRKKYHIGKEKLVIGFIGTFGAWHGAEILAEAYVGLHKRYPNTHLMMIGDGLRMAQVREIIEKNQMESAVTLTGIVPQKDGALYLAACDVLASPTVKNPDGTPFFGSPTKLFEYMAMGKAIVASAIDQMAEILEDGETALLTQPGDVGGVEAAIARLIEDEKMRQHLGKHARIKVCREYTWAIHTQKIVDALRKIMVE